MKKKTKKAAPTEPTHTTTIAKPCIFTPADRKRLKPLLSKDSFDQLMKLKEHEKVPLPLIDPVGDEIDMHGPISINWWHDNNFETIYQIGQRVYIYDDYNEVLIYESSDPVKVIWEFYPADDEYFEEKCAGFGIAPPLRPVKRGHDESCRVWIKTFYRDSYSAHGDSERWARDDDGKLIIFDNYSEARKWINQNKQEHHGYPDIVYPKGHYLYSNNEYAPREYKICG